VDKRQRAYLVCGIAVLVGGGCVALVGWFGWAQANLYVGVPAAFVATAGLAVSVYALFADTHPARVQRVDRSEIRGNNRMIIHAAEGDADRDGATHQQVLRRSKVEKNNTMETGAPEGREPKGRA
jgi:hypothetical protein